jgi:hypothetical protein
MITSERSHSLDFIYPYLGRHWIIPVLSLEDNPFDLQWLVPLIISSRSCAIIYIPLSPAHSNQWRFSSPPRARLRQEKGLAQKWMGPLLPQRSMSAFPYKSLFESWVIGIYRISRKQFFVSLVLTGLTIVGAFGIEWRSVKEGWSDE